MIDGQVEFTIGDTVSLAGPGSVQYLRGRASHRPSARGRARLLMVTIGPPYGAFAREMAQLFDSSAPLADIGAAADRYGVTLA